MSHTPGPWKTGYAFWDETGDVAYVLEGVKEANAADCRLIGAAPDLLAALEAAKRVIFSWHGPDAWETYDAQAPEMAPINAAIAKAKGETE